MFRSLVYKVPIRKHAIFKRSFIKWVKNKKDLGMSLAPWVLLYFFIAVFLLLIFFQHNLHISTKYVVEDGLAAAALAGEVADLDIYSQYQELVITDLDYAREVFEDSLKAALELDDEGYPKGESVYFVESVPVQIMELSVYNVSGGQVYKTNLLTEAGQLQYETVGGLAFDDRYIAQGPLLDDSGAYRCAVTMLDGEEKLIRNTSLYARIRFGIPGYNGADMMLEKDIMTDIQINE